VLYRIARPLLFSLPPERAHHLAFGALRFAAAMPFGKSMLSALYAPPRDPALAIDALGLRFPTPIGLAAGFDKDAVGHEALLALGFGFVEVGTLTGDAQPGNPQPRMFRLPADRALVNRLGFNNGGAAGALPRLRARERERGIVGVNVGKTKKVPEEAAIDDYVKSTRLVAPYADYLVVNVSSPNTPGLRNLQSVEKLAPLLSAVARAIDESTASSATQPPLLVKIAPDLADEDVLAVADLALSLGLAGIVATNTTIARDGLASPKALVSDVGVGGLSGAPLKERSLEVLRLLRGRVGTKLTLVSVGGIETGDDAWARITAGASLVQLYTGFIYGGPDTPGRIARELLARARSAGFAKVQDAIGSAAS
jgi:dihydroorotate dehydrogenase